jgi:phosphatidylglycerophosphate synthase
MPERDGVFRRDAFARGALYAGVFLATSLLLASLPGGRYGTPAVIVVVLLGSAAGASYLRCYLRLRREEGGPFVGSRRAPDLLIFLLGLAVLVALLILELTTSDAAAIAAAALMVVSFVMFSTVLIVSERRRLARYPVA